MGSRRYVSLAWGAPKSLHDSWPLAVRLLKNYTAPYSDQVPYHLSPSSNKPLLSLSISISLHQSRFFFSYPQSRLEGFFIDNIYTLWSLGFFPQSPSLIGRFFIDWFFVRFSSPVSPSSGWEVFHQQHDLLKLISFPIELGYSQWSPGFPLQSLSLGWEVFYQVPISLQRFHTQQSSRPKKEAIVITWPLERRVSEVKVT